MSSPAEMEEQHEQISSVLVKLSRDIYRTMNPSPSPLAALGHSPPLSANRGIFMLFSRFLLSDNESKTSNGYKSTCYLCTSRGILIQSLSTVVGARYPVLDTVTHDRCDVGSGYLLCHDS